MNCTQDDRDRIVCLTRGQSIGLALDAEAGLISVTAVVCVFILIFVSPYLFMTWPKSNCVVIQIKVWRSGKLVRRPMDLFVVRPRPSIR